MYANPKRTWEKSLVLLQPLAYHDADRLVTVMHDRFGPVATGNYLDWREQSQSF